MPFEQADITSLLGAILTRNPEPLPMTVPKPLQNVIARALAKDSNLRYRSAAAMRTSLRNPQETDPNFQPDKSVTTIQSPKYNASSQPSHLRQETEGDESFALKVLGYFLGVGFFIFHGVYELLQSLHENINLWAWSALGIGILTIFTGWHFAGGVATIILALIGLGFAREMLDQGKKVAGVALGIGILMVGWTYLPSSLPTNQLLGVDPKQTQSNSVQMAANSLEPQKGSSINNSLTPAPIPSPSFPFSVTNTNEHFRSDLALISAYQIAIPNDNQWHDTNITLYPQNQLQFGFMNNTEGRVEHKVGSLTGTFSEAQPESTWYEYNLVRASPRPKWDHLFKNSDTLKVRSSQKNVFIRLEVRQLKSR